MTSACHETRRGRAHRCVIGFETVSAGCIPHHPVFRNQYLRRRPAINPGVDLTQLKHDTLFKSARSALSNGRLPFRDLDRAGGEFRHFSRADGVIIPRERDIHPSWNDFGYG